MENTISNVSVSSEEHGFINRNALKYIVIVAMLIDHIGELFESSIDPNIYHIMRFIGRLTGPTMAFFLAEGAKYTRDIAKYQKRLAIFAAISWLPFIFANPGPQKLIESPVYFLQQSVIYTLFLGITAIRIWDSPNYEKDAKIIFIFLLCLASVIGDWPIMDVLAPLFMYIYRDDKKKRYIAVTLAYLPMMLMVLIMDGWHQAGVLMVPLIIIFCYNGKGGKKNAFNKWFFYIFYPAHLLILGIIKWVVLA
ncbi:TraX family protein [Ruminococcus albus]|uniref:TraX protein n=1 Tax=Ruminococcus albus TaxID=1264 RepID=A0A1I1E560_RUMAL|nr:TraX family protein [Ruminococcus albus]SFB80368.1 TraX protein [Ruminococcus albus]